MLLADANRSSHEEALFARVKRYQERTASVNLSAEAILAISKQEGVDFATTLLYQYIRQSAEHAPFIRSIESSDDDFNLSFDPNFRIVIVPGAFYREFPNSGADGRMLRQAAQELGIPVDVIPLKSFGSLKENATIIENWLQQNNDRPIVLVSLSKGASDLRVAFAREGAPQTFQSVKAWINLSGITYGSPIVEWLFAYKLRSLWYWLLLALQGHDFRVARQMGCDPKSPLSNDLKIPPDMQVIHVVGFPLHCHMTSPLARRMHRRIAPQGPNDGGGIRLADVLRLPGLVYPVWGADHYLRPPGRDMQRLIRAILHFVLESKRTDHFQSATTGALS
jgi:hypothetical protein